MTQLHIRGQRGWNCFLQDQKYLDVGKHLLHIKVITSAYNLGQTDQFGMSSQCVCVCFSTSSGTALPASLWLSAKVKLFLQLPLQILELKIDHRAVFNSPLSSLEVGRVITPLLIHPVTLQPSCQRTNTGSCSKEPGL